MKEVSKDLEADTENIYRYKTRDGRTCWLRVQIQDEKTKRLGVIEDVTDDIISKRKIEYERDHDVLTHLLNRRAFNVQVRKTMKDPSMKKAAFIMWDLDNLKYINDTYGHDYGDQYIQRAAAVLNQATIDNAIVARLSGDEFCMFFHDYKEKEEVRRRVQDIRDQLYRTRLAVPDGTSLRIRISAGIAWYPEDSMNYQQLMKFSDFAMYKIKNTDKGNIGEFDRTSYEIDSILLDGKEDLNQFIEGELVKFAFQPIVDAKTGEVFGYEALMRPQMKNLRSPDDIIRLASSQSKLSEIERITCFKAMENFTQQKAAFGQAKIFINSIPNHRMLDKDMRKFESMYKNDLNRIVIEIIENEQSNEECTRVKQEAAARWGSHLALDDFGSGYNSETSLLILCPKFIKIDMGIIRGIHQDYNRQKLVENIVSYAKNRQIKVIAEGVETEDEMNKVIDLGVDYMQGYYLGMPQMEAKAISQEIIDQIKKKRRYHL